MLLFYSIPHIQSWISTVLIVSHDRAFLTNVCTDIIHMHSHRLDSYRGNYEVNTVEARYNHYLNIVIVWTPSDISHGKNRKAEESAAWIRGTDAVQTTLTGNGIRTPLPSEVNEQGQRERWWWGRPHTSTHIHYSLFIALWLIIDVKLHF